MLHSQPVKQCSHVMVSGVVLWRGVLGTDCVSNALPWCRTRYGMTEL